MPAFVSKHLILSDMKTYDFLSRERYASVAYSSPAVDVFSYFCEGVLCASGDYFLGGGGIYDDDHTNDNGEY